MINLWGSLSITILGTFGILSNPWFKIPITDKHSYRKIHTYMLLVTFFCILLFYFMNKFKTFLLKIVVACMQVHLMAITNCFFIWGVCVCFCIMFNVLFFRCQPQRFKLAVSERKFQSQILCIQHNTLYISSSFFCVLNSQKMMLVKQ